MESFSCGKENDLFKARIPDFTASSLLLKQRREILRKNGFLSFSDSSCYLLSYFADRKAAVSLNANKGQKGFA
ncbi:MAG: hypothetical protein GXO77_04670 [Calditrichaeota bacterium]|nr:hypothetical protein [Calditrichota bacterium]